MGRWLRWLPFVMALAVALVACQPGEVRTVDRAPGRAAVVTMTLAVEAAAKHCTAHGQWLATLGPREAELADRLYEQCVARLIPARDAVVFAVEEVDPWTPASSAVVGCAGKAVRVALQGLVRDFAVWGVKVPSLVRDGIELGIATEVYAEPRCDPLHPTTRVRVFVDPDIAPIIDPGPPAPLGT